MASGLELEEAVVDDIRSWRSLANSGQVSDLKQLGRIDGKLDEICEGLPVTVDACSWEAVAGVDAMLIRSFKGVLLYGFDDRWQFCVNW